jgi:N-acetylglucosaminyl-diphospho-decaprenol L-rhamnosyltransferase
VSVAAIVVNFRTANATIEAVGTLLRELGPVPDALIVVVDNQSGDGSLERLREAFGGPEHAARVAVIDSGHNGGYGFGINVGVAHALRGGARRYVYIVNPDAWVEPASLAKLLSFMDAHADVGLVGSTVRGPGGEVQGQAFRFPSVLSELESMARVGVISKLLASTIVSLKPSQTMEVDWVPGTSMLVRAEVFARGGWFDPGFFLYYEEIDFSRRVKQAGWKVFYVDDAPITHIGSLATGMADESRPLPRYWFESRRRYFVKHHGRAYAALSDAAWFLGHLIYQAKALVVSGSTPTRPSLGRDFLRFTLAEIARPAPFAERNRDVTTPDVTATPGR